MATEASARKFFTAPSFAVVGASSNPAKFGHKVHAWYLERDLKVTPVNPASPTVTVNGSEHATVPNVSALPNPKETGVSIITHPGITIGVLKEAKTAGIPSIWLQPGTWDDEVLKFALAEGTFEAVVYGEGGRGHDGWCVLIDGDKALKAAGKL
ncbi:hypothetical protein ARSEF4850_003381 [Beauveria asiatica]